MIYRQAAKTPRREPSKRLDDLAKQIVDAAFKVHTELGPGLLEGVYEVCLAHELARRNIRAERQVHLPVVYDGVHIEAGLRIDLMVEGEIVVELKAAEELLPVHRAQLMTYLKLARKSLGFLINFNVALIRDGIKRVVLNPPPIASDNT